MDYKNSKNIHLAVLDFDDTLINGQSQKMFIEFLFKKKYISFLKYFSIMIWFTFFKLGFSISIKSIFKYALSTIRNNRIEKIDYIFDEFFNKVCVPKIYKNSKNLISFLKERNFYTIIISTAIDPIVLRAQKYFDVDDIVCTKLERLNGVYTGKILEEPMFSKHKTKVLTSFIKSNNLSEKPIYVFADHETDIGILSIVSNPIATNPTSKLLKYAQDKEWSMLYLNSDESFQYFKSNIMFK